MSDCPDVANAALLMTDRGDRNGVRWDGWRVVFPTDAESAWPRSMPIGSMESRYATPRRTTSLLRPRAAPSVPPRSVDRSKPSHATFSRSLPGRLPRT